AALFPPNSGVLSLDYRSFPSKILQVEKPAIVAFTAPWCGHCQRLTPEFTKAAKNLEGIVHFANVDCDEDKNKQMCSQYEVKGFPTILVFPATKRRIPKTYQGERVAKALVEYAVSTLPHSVKKLKAEELPAWVQGIGPITADGTPDTKGINGRGKVLLLSNKPTSSPLYKSLALDF
ncbi:thioredoxin-domain-containing protein, partial [Microstroma glucosiphilum]